MGDKKRRSFSIDEDVASQLTDRENLNASGVVNELLRQYLAQGESADAGLQMRLKDLDREIDQLKTEKGRVETKIERKKREREDVRRQIEQRREKGREHIDAFVEKVLTQGFPKENLKASNPAVKNYATKASMTPEKFIELVRENL